MTDPNGTQVFISYARDDRSRVRPIVEKLETTGLKVWWDPHLEGGSTFRDVILDQLKRAKAVCVFWSETSVKRRFVRDEANRAAERGVLVPVLLDSVELPLGFGEFHTYSLVKIEFFDHELEKITSTIRRLVEDGRHIETVQSLAKEIQRARSGTNEAEGFVSSVRALSDLWKQNPGSERALQNALSEVRSTYKGVIDAIDEFLRPLAQKVDPDIAQYMRIAKDEMTVEIERRRGSCARIGTIYDESGGVRDLLPTTVSDQAKSALDQLINNIRHSDQDLFKAMASVGPALGKDAAMIVNALLADQPQAASAHLRRSAATLIPLQQKLARGMAKLDHLILDLGIDMADPSGEQGKN
jgi:TIR domain